MNCEGRGKEGEREEEEKEEEVEVVEVEVEEEQLADVSYASSFLARDGAGSPHRWKSYVPQ